MLLAGSNHSPGSLSTDPKPSADLMLTVPFPSLFPSPSPPPALDLEPTRLLRDHGVPSPLFASRHSSHSPSSPSNPPRSTSQTAPRRTFSRATPSAHCRRSATRITSTCSGAPRWPLLRSRRRCGFGSHSEVVGLGSGEGRNELEGLGHGGVGRATGPAFDRDNFGRGRRRRFGGVMCVGGRGRSFRPGRYWELRAQACKFRTRHDG